MQKASNPALLELVLKSPRRIMSYDLIASELGFESDNDVELELLRAIDAGIFKGKVDTEAQHVVIDDTALPEPTSDLVADAREYLTRHPSFSRERDSPKRALKRPRDAVLHS